MRQGSPTAAPPLRMCREPPPTPTAIPAHMVARTHIHGMMGRPAVDAPASHSYRHGIGCAWGGVAHPRGGEEVLPPLTLLLRAGARQG